MCSLYHQNDAKNRDLKTVSIKILCLLRHGTDKNKVEQKSNVFLSYCITKETIRSTVIVPLNLTIWKMVVNIVYFPRMEDSPVSPSD